jgi:hypothetical protein
MKRSPAGLLIIRAWLEPGSRSPLRAHIRLTADVARGLERSLTVSREAEVLQAVQAWLSEVLAGPPAPDDVENR